MNGVMLNPADFQGAAEKNEILNHVLAEVKVSLRPDFNYSRMYHRHMKTGTWGIERIDKEVLQWIAK